MKRYMLVIIVGFVLAAVFNQSCSPAPGKKNDLVIGVGGSLNLGPNNPVLIQRNANVWESFTRLDDSYIPQPELAESWEADDTGTRWTLRLRRDVVFHNGDSLNAELAIANIKRYHGHPEFDYYGTYTHLDSLYALGPYEVMLVFSRPCVDFPNKIGHYFSGIFSPKSFDEAGKIVEPIGCGPYRFVKSETGKYDLIAAFDRYYKGKPAFDTVEFRIIPDPLVRIMALMKGDIDIVAHHGGVLSEHRAMLAGNAAVAIDSCDIGVTHYLIFNCKSGLFADNRNRRYFSAILNRAEIVNLILRGKGIPAHDYFVEAITAYDHRRFSPSPDSSLAMPSSFSNETVTIALSQGDAANWDYKQVAEYLADYLKKKGIAVTIVTMESGAWQRAVDNGDYSVALYPLSIPTGTPELFIRALAYSGGLKVRKSGNRSHFSSKEVDTLVDRAITAPNIAERDSLYNRLLDILAEEQPVVPLYHDRYYFAYRAGLHVEHPDPFLKLDIHAVTGDAR